MIQKKPKDVFLILQTMLLFHVFDLSLRVWPFERVLSWVLARSRKETAHGLATGNERIITVMQRAIVLIRKFDWRSRLDCLPRSLAVYWVLRRRGLPSELVMGVKKDPFGAHAWVEVDGDVISDYGDEHTEYVVLMRGEAFAT